MREVNKQQAQERFNQAIWKNFIPQNEMDKAALIVKNGYKVDEVHPLRVFDGAVEYKSAFRAIRRGHISVDGTIFPKRPFNNRKDTVGRSDNMKKKLVYGEYKQFLARDN